MAPVNEMVLDTWLSEIQLDMKNQFSTQAKLPNWFRQCMTRSVTFWILIRTLNSEFFSLSCTVYCNLNQYQWLEPVQLSSYTGYFLSIVELRYRQRALPDKYIRSVQWTSKSKRRMFKMILSFSPNPLSTHSISRVIRVQS